MKEIPKHIETSVFELAEMFPERAKATSEALLKVQGKFEGENKIYAPINEVDLPFFNDAYFFRNALKVMISLDDAEIDINDYQEIRDLGSGVGTASIAALLLNDRSSLSLPRFVLEDRSSFQLQEASSNIDVVCKSGFSCKVAPDLSKEISVYEENRLTIGSYILCELFGDSVHHSDVSRILKRNYILMDYGRVLSRILHNSIFEIDRCKFFREIYEVPRGIHEYIGQSTARVNYLHVW